MDDRDSRQRQSAAAKARAARPEERVRLVSHFRAMGEQPAMRELRSANAKAQWRDPAAREARSQAYRERWADPDFKAAVLAKRRATAKFRTGEIE